MRGKINGLITVLNRDTFLVYKYLVSLFSTFINSVLSFLQINTV